MIRNRNQARAPRLARTALCAALVLGLMSGTSAMAAPAQAQKPAAPKITLSKTFQPLFNNMSKAIETAKTRADVVAARSSVSTAQSAAQQARGAARTQAQANLDSTLAALGTCANPRNRCDHRL